jgi:hypothetical protein
MEPGYFLPNSLGGLHMKHTLLPLLLLTAVIGFPLAKADDQTQVTIPAETQVTTTAGAVTLNDQTTYFINDNSVRIRSVDGKILGELSLNDKVKVINPTVIYNKNLVEISIVRTYDPITTSEKYLVSTQYLSPKIVDYKEFVGKYFVVVNVATETIRVYERMCADNSCPSKMLMESEVVVGEDINLSKEDKGKGRSILGSYRVTGWTKFYQDPEGHYPSWYRDGYPAIPGENASWSEWFSKKVMPLDEKGKHIGKMRGAFGWYTAFVAPEPFGQWTHGTLGWGSDKDTYIKKVKRPLINMVSDPRSSGCTRNNNEAIAFLRSIIDVGAPIIKIYAKEAIMDQNLSRYPNTTTEWKYVLTKSKNQAIARSEVEKNLGINDADLDAFWEAKKLGGEMILDPKSPLNQILEVGTYDIDTHPDIIEYTPGGMLTRFSRKIDRHGNVYGVKEKEMHGTFYVDAGVLSGYAHPDSTLDVSGFRDEVTPPWMDISLLKN